MKVEVHVDCSDGLTFKRPSLVKVQFADDCDLGKIVKRFIRTGELPNLAVKQPLNIDASQLPDEFQDMQQWRVDLSNSFEKESQLVKDFCQHDLERYAEFNALSGVEQVNLLKSKGFTEDQIKSVIVNADLFDQQQQLQPQPQQQQQQQPQQQQQQQPQTV